MAKASKKVIIIADFSKYVNKLGNFPLPVEVVEFGWKFSKTQIELKSRSLLVKELKFLERIDDDHVLLQLTCGKCGYVRSIARDLGKDLKCFAHVKWLRRIWSGPFKLENCILVIN